MQRDYRTLSVFTGNVQSGVIFDLLLTSMVWGCHLFYSGPPIGLLDERVASVRWRT